MSLFIDRSIVFFFTYKMLEILSRYQCPFPDKDIIICIHILKQIIIIIMHFLLFNTLVIILIPICLSDSNLTGELIQYIIEIE